jgi:hypothetical protein
VLGQNEPALFHAQRSLEAAKAVDDPARLGFAHLALAYAWEWRRDLDRAVAAYTEAFPAWSAAGDADNAWYAHAELADKRLLQGELSVGVPTLEEALAWLRHTDRSLLVLLVINLRGHAALLQRDLPLAALLFTESVDRARALQNTPALLSGMAGVAGVTLANGQAAQAVRLLGAVDAARESAGLKRIDNALHAERIWADARTLVEGAVFESAWSSGRALPLEEAVLEVLTIADEVATSADG